MKKLIIAAVVILGLACSGFGQYMTINYDLEKNYFNEGQPLPSERTLMFTGLVPEGVDIIEINIFPSKAKKDKDRLYLASWKDFDNDTNTNYSLAVNYRLRASEKYDFRLDFFEQIPSNDQQELTERIIDQATAYLDANVTIKGNSITATKREKKMVAELEEIIQAALHNYRNQNDTGFAGLSETVGQKITNLGTIDFGKLPKDTTANAAENQRRILVAEKIQDLQAVIASDIRETMSKPWSKLAISRYIDDYETEEKKGSFSLSVGYGGVHLNGQLDDFTYGASPYLGVAFPLSNSTLAPKFLRNSSVVLGAFLKNFEDVNGNKVSGMIVDRPVYLGLDYKLFEFIRFNAGAAFLEKTEVGNITGGTDQINKKAFIRPFVGLSARIDLSVGFGK